MDNKTYLVNRSPSFIISYGTTLLLVVLLGLILISTNVQSTQVITGELQLAKKNNKILLKGDGGEIHTLVGNFYLLNDSIDNDIPLYLMDAADTDMLSKKYGIFIRDGYCDKSPVCQRIDGRRAVVTTNPTLFSILFSKISFTGGR